MIILVFALICTAYLFIIFVVDGILLYRRRIKVSKKDIGIATITKVKGLRNNSEDKGSPKYYCDVIFPNYKLENVRLRNVEDEYYVGSTVEVYRFRKKVVEQYLDKDEALKSLKFSIGIFVVISTSFIGILKR